MFGVEGVWGAAMLNVGKWNGEKSVRKKRKEAMMRWWNKNNAGNMEKRGARKCWCRWNTGNRAEKEAVMG
jgi:hypothetical protein